MVAVVAVTGFCFTGETNLPQNRIMSSAIFGFEIRIEIPKNNVLIFVWNALKYGLGRNKKLQKSALLKG
jgi:hypothetical protein